MYVASFDTKALGSVRHLPIQRAAAVVNGWDFPTKQLFSFVAFCSWFCPPWENPYHSFFYNGIHFEYVEWCDADYP